MTTGKPVLVKSVKGFLGRWLRGSLGGYLCDVRRMLFHMCLLARLGRFVGAGCDLFVAVFLFLLHLLVVGNVTGVSHRMLFAWWGGQSHFTKAPRR